MTFYQYNTVGLLAELTLLLYPLFHYFILPKAFELVEKYTSNVAPKYKRVRVKADHREYHKK